MPTRPGRWLHAVGTLAVAVLAWLAYAPVLGAYFRHDDFWWLSTARQWAAGTLPLTRAPAGVAPLYSLLYSFLYQTWGLDPRPYFASLLLCHVLDSCLVLALVWLLTRRFLAGLTGGLLFALLFCHHEAVAWPAGGPHVFALAGILLSLICWVLYRQGRRWGLPLAVVFALAATFTKDSGIAVVPLLLVLDLAGFPRQRRWPLACLALPLLALGAWRVLIPPIAEPMRPGSPSFHLGLHCLWNLVHNPPQMLVPDLRFENYQQFLSRLLPPGAVSATLLGSQVAILLLSALAAWGLATGNRQQATGNRQQATGNRPGQTRHPLVLPGVPALHPLLPGLCPRPALSVHPLDWVRLAGWRGGAGDRPSDEAGLQRRTRRGSGALRGLSGGELRLRPVGLRQPSVGERPAAAGHRRSAAAPPRSAAGGRDRPDRTAGLPVGRGGRATPEL